ncbi:DUF4349 domain-containing protein [Tsukamurella sp. 1534]|uniref:DUF4349 domain-containing protein n=1 Tax=Tsukamurella sp. 1534 TaxID=1151061 RepID=UPI0002ECFE82|nr:DUF4349 domain-containing protein [Tsukamurella sp. 1534]
MTTQHTPGEILTEDRIDRMRDTVLREVNDDIGDLRARHRRRSAGLAAAAAVAVVAVGGGVIAGTQLTGGSSSAPADRAEKSFSAPLTGGTPAPGAGALPGPASAPTAPSTPPRAQPDRQVITTGTVELTAGDPREVVADLVAAAEKMGGRVDERRETGGETTSATVELRVPGDKVSALVDEASGLGEVGSVRLEHDDVTAAVVDLDARIRATQLSVNRLTDILGRADTSDKVIQAEGALTQRQQELESLQSRRASIGEQVALSTVTVTVEAPKPGADRSGFVGGLQDGWDALLGAGRWLLVVAGAALPWFALLLVLYGGYRGFRRIRSRG